MFRTRPAGVAMIVVAALISTSTAYLLATRTVVTSGPVDFPPVAPIPSDTLAEHETAVQATLLCLAAAGMVPVTETARGKSVTRITVDGQSLEPERAEAIIDGCRADSNLDVFEQSQGDRLLRTDSSETEEAGDRRDCLVSRSSGRAFCFDDIIAAAGLQPLAALQ